MTDRNTCCWQCNKSYNMRSLVCPNCGVANANQDLTQANAESIDQETVYEKSNNLPVAEIIECTVMGQQTIKEIDGRLRFLRIGDKLYAKPSQVAQSEQTAEKVKNAPYEQIKKLCRLYLDDEQGQYRANAIFTQIFAAAAIARPEQQAVPNDAPEVNYRRGYGVALSDAEEAIDDECRKRVVTASDCIELIRNLGAAPQPEQTTNFCSRCGKLVVASHDSHTCTPPVGHTN